MDETADAVRTLLVDENGDPVPAGGGSGGVQYTEGATDATITGTAMLFEGDADDLLVPSAANPLPVTGTFDPPVGGATEAKQDTMIGHLDGVEGLLTTIDADTGGILTSVQTLDNAISGNEMQVDVVAALPAGDNNIGNVDVVTLPAIPAGNNNIGDVDVASIAAGTNTIGAVNVKPATSGGLSIARDLDLDETELEIKATAGQLFGWYIYNDGAAEVYVKLYNATAANVTVGTTTPVMTVAIPAGSAANVEFTNGIAFGTAICAAATTGVADNDTTAPAANQCVANFLFA